MSFNLSSSAILILSIKNARKTFSICSMQHFFDFVFREFLETVNENRLRTKAAPIENRNLFCREIVESYGFFSKKYGILARLISLLSLFNQFAKSISPR